MDKIKVVTFLVVLGSITFLPCGAWNKSQKLIWTQSPLVPLPISSMLLIEGDPNGWIPDPTPPRIKPLTTSIHQWGSVVKALGFSYRHNLLVWSEAARRRIQTVQMDRVENHPEDLVTGTSSEVNGVAVDWINNNVYWTDGLYNWVAMAPLSRPRPSSSSSPPPPSPPGGAGRRVLKIVAQEGLDNPHGVAVHPGKNWLLISDGGVRPRIERMDLLGRNREALVDSDMLAPRGLVIDMQQLRLFWVDEFKGTVESIHLRGTDRRRVVLFRGVGFKFFDIAFYQNYLFLTDQSHIDLKILDLDKEGNRKDENKEELGAEQTEAEEKKDKEENKGDKNMSSVVLGNKPYGIVMFHESQQPPILSQCDKAECDHMCVEREAGKVHCVCGDGYDLMDDRTHCVAQKQFPLPSHLYALGVAVCMYPAHVADMSMSNVSLTSQCGTLNANLGYLALSFDARRNELFFSGNNTRTIFAMTMEIAAKPRVIVSGTGVVKGLCADWESGLLYWTDSSRGQIVAARMDGSFQTVLLTTGLHHPLGIAVHPRRGKMYWTDQGFPPEVGPTVESANMDGSGRRVLVEGQALGQPNHVFIDYKTDRLYWADSGKNQVVVYDLNDDQWKVFCKLPDATFYGITLYKDYLLWTDTKHGMNGIHMVRMDQKRKMRGIIHPGYGLAADLITVDKSMQPDMASPCTQSQTLCDQLCLPRGSDNHTCGCGLGFTLQGGMVCRYGKFSTDNFLLVTDAYQRNVYQIDVTRGVINAVTRGERHQPIAIDFLPGKPGRVFWSDNVAHVIRGKELGFGWTSTFLYLPEGPVKRMKKRYLDDPTVEVPLSMKYRWKQKSSEVDNLELQAMTSHTVESDSKVEGIAVDPLHQLLYYTDTGRDVIGVADLGDTVPTNRHSVIISRGLKNPRDIVVFASQLRSSRGKIYWTDWGGKATINEASMTGGQRRVVVTVNHTAWLNGLALDRTDQALYWADGYNNNVGVYNLKTRQYRILLTTPAAHFYGLYLMGDFIYLTDWRRRFLLRMPKQGGNGTLMQFGEGKFNKLYGITGYNSSEYPKGGGGVCSRQRECGPGSLCLPRSFTAFSCVCISGYVRMGPHCFYTTTTTPLATRQGISKSPEHLEWHRQAKNGTGRHGKPPKSAAKGGATAGIVVLAVTGMVVFGIAAGVGVFCFNRHRRSYQVPHARLGTEDRPDRPEVPAVAVRPSTAVGPTPSRMPSALAHLKVFYARRPSAEQVRIEEAGFDNPSYNEAAVAMMPRQVSSSSEDNQPTL